VNDDALERAARAGSHENYIVELLKQTQEFQDLKAKKLSGAELDAAIDELIGKMKRAGAARLIPFLSEQPALVRGEEDLNQLFALFIRGNFKGIDHWLDQRFVETKNWWKEKLGVPPHRRADLEKMQMYSEAARLRETEKLSWAGVARRLDSKGYNADPRACIERFRKGVKKCKQLTLKVHTGQL
jgi:hypothetical protein